jgi:para-aminobenzoate synthetase/4-amino-4-deoxychorismate lyase
MRGERIWLGAGGGIVADSDPDAEYRECLDKARPLIAAVGAEFEQESSATGRLPGPPLRLPRPDPALGVFETLLVEDGEAAELDAHLARLERSLRVLYATDLDPGLARRAREAAAACDSPARMRITFSGGAVDVHTAALVPGATHPDAIAELTPIVLPGGLGAHKWNDRRILDAVSGEALIVDLGGEVLEAGAGAIVIAEGERLVSPPADGRVLPSVTLAAWPGVAREPLTLDRMAAADEVLVVSAIRRRQRARIGG